MQQCWSKWNAYLSQLHERVSEYDTRNKKRALKNQCSSAFNSYPMFHPNNRRTCISTCRDRRNHLPSCRDHPFQNRMQRLSAIELRPMETLSSQQQQKHQKMRLPMTAVVESDLNPIDCDVPLLRSNSFVPSESRLSPATNLSNRQPMFARCRTPNLPANSRSRSRLADRKRPIHVFSCSRLIR
jgi:hypothetical protein